MDKQPLDLKHLIPLQQWFAKQSRDTHLVAVSPWGIHIEPCAMTEVAPLAQWTLNEPFNAEGPCKFKHRVLFGGVEFYCISENTVQA